MHSSRELADHLGKRIQGKKKKKKIWKKIWSFYHKIICQKVEVSVTNILIIDINVTKEYKMATSIKWWILQLSPKLIVRLCTVHRCRCAQIWSF